MIAARALEQFLEELITKSALITGSLSAKTLTPEHIRTHIFADPRLFFLHDLANRAATGPGTTSSGRSLSTSISMTTTSHQSRQILRQQNSINQNNDNELITDSDALIIAFHHAAFDRSSFPIFFNDLCSAYNSNTTVSVDEESFQYIDYVDSAC